MQYFKFHYPFHPQQHVLNLTALCKVNCLEGHVDITAKLYADVSEKVNTPLSSVDCHEILTFMEEIKKRMHPIEADIRDAKRRVTAAKGPKKKKKAAPEVGASDAESSADSN